MAKALVAISPESRSCHPRYLPNQDGFDLSAVDGAPRPAIERLDDISRIKIAPVRESGVQNRESERTRRHPPPATQTFIPSNHVLCTSGYPIEHHPPVACFSKYRPPQTTNVPEAVHSVRHTTTFQLANPVAYPTTVPPRQPPASSVRFPNVPSRSPHPNLAVLKLLTLISPFLNSAPPAPPALPELPSPRLRPT